MSRTFIGIDPGKSGGYAIIEEINGKQDITVVAWDDDSFVSDMKCVSEDILEGRTVVCALEKVGAMPGNGSVSMFQFGKSAGFIEGVLRTCRIPYQLVPPRKWKASFSLTNDKKLSVETCKKLFPDVDLRATERCRKDSDGKAEALLLADYARRHM